MQYISPLHFVEFSGDTIDRKDISLARRKMLAELELNDGKGVEINGKEVSKNDIVLFFDDLQQSSQLSYHTAVYRDKVLLRFLEQGVLDGRGFFAQNSLYTDEAFIDWIGPYYADSFIAYSTDCFRLLNVEKWDTLMNNPLLMNTYYREIAWEILEKKTREIICQMRVIAQRRPGRNDLFELGRLCDTRRLKMLSQLPVERFYMVRDEMADALMQVCIMLYNIGNHEWGLINMRNAYTLSVSEGLKVVLHNKRLEMEDILRRSKRKQRYHWIKTALIIAAVPAFFFVVGLFTDNNKIIINSSNNDTVPAQQPSLTPVLPKDSTRLHKAERPLKQLKKDFLK